MSTKPQAIKEKSLEVKVSIVVPVYNEVENIAGLAAEIIRAMRRNLSYEIIFVDDGSSDNTPALIDELGSMHQTLRFVCHSRNLGQSAAIATGVYNAAGPIIVTLDGDGQNDPGDIPRLLQCYKENESRYQGRILISGRRRKRMDSHLKRVSSRIANKVRMCLLKDNIADTGCGLKVFSKHLFLSLPAFDHMHRFLPALVIRNNGTVFSVDVNHRHRVRGKSKYGLLNRLWIGIVDLLGVMWLQRRPLTPQTDQILDNNHGH